jgi:hypothetical protein
MEQAANLCNDKVDEYGCEQKAIGRAIVSCFETVTENPL